MAEWSSLLASIKCFNRTFMELKWGTHYYKTYKILVLIVPLWNWNGYPGNEYTICRVVLIVPLWNWNRAEMIIIVFIILF